MLPKGLVSFSAFDLERKAAQTLRRRVDVEFSAPINIEQLVENEANVDLKIMDGLRINHRVEGCVCKRFMSRQLTVIIDYGVYSGSWAGYNAALGEEYAHIVLHPSLFLYVDSLEDFLALQSEPEWPRFERDARRASAAIRMPPGLITYEAEAAYRRIIIENGFVDAIHIEKQLRNKLAERFRVDPDEMQMRLSNWPCNIRDRLFTSVQSRSLNLLPERSRPTADPHFVQRIVDAKNLPPN